MSVLIFENGVRDDRRDGIVIVMRAPGAARGTLEAHGSTAAARNP